MNENQKYLKQAKAHITTFEMEMEPERLNEASMALDNVDLAQERDHKNRTALRTAVLSLWLSILQQIDQHIDLKFNPNDVPSKLVQPPPIPGDVVLRPGADPSAIKDPKARVEYEKAIAANRSKAIKYRMQVLLNRLNNDIPPRTKAFIRNSYSSASTDQVELRTEINKIIKHPQRKEQLLELLTPAPRN